MPTGPAQPARTYLSGYVRRQPVRVIGQVRPTAFFGVPRVWEKIRVGIEALLAAEQDEGKRAAVAQALAYGDRRPCVVALLTPDGEAAPAWARARGITAASLAQLASPPQVAAGVAAANQQLARVQQVKRWRLLPVEWTAETEELTFTLKLKRSVVHASMPTSSTPYTPDDPGRPRRLGHSLSSRTRQTRASPTHARRHEGEFGRVGRLVPCYPERARDPFRAPDASAVVMRKEPQLMPGLYGPGHFTEDPYSQVVSPHGIPVDDLVSVLQKEIRRSRIDNAVLAAYEIFTTSADVAQHLWRRLRVIAVEDVGRGMPLGPVLIDVLHRNFNATPGGDWMMACHAVRLLASAPKDRTSSEHADWVAAKVAAGEALVEVPDYAHCVHTRAGQELGRGLIQWWDNGAQVCDELPSADHRYREELIEIHRRDEAENEIAARPSRWASTTAAPVERATGIEPA